MLLLRVHQFDDRRHAFAVRLERESGLPLCCIADERDGTLDCHDLPKISLSRKSCIDMGLYCPTSFAWTCGDYGLYLARAAWPHIRQFWLIEHDVRFAMEDIGAFFRSFVGHERVDFIAPLLRRRGTDWFWHHTVACHDGPVVSCCFSPIRMSSGAIDFALSLRQRQSRSILCRASWANDEAFTATMLARHGFACADLNDFGHRFYTDATICYDRATAGEELERRLPDGMIYHPVLFGEAYQQRQQRLLKPATFYEKARRRALTRLRMRLPPRMLS